MDLETCIVLLVSIPISIFIGVPLARFIILFMRSFFDGSN